MRAFKEVLWGKNIMKGSNTKFTSVSRLFCGHTEWTQWFSPTPSSLYRFYFPPIKSHNVYRVHNYFDKRTKQTTHLFIWRMLFVWNLKWKNPILIISHWCFGQLTGSESLQANPPNYRLICTLVFPPWVINVLCFVSEGGLWLSSFFPPPRGPAELFRAEVSHRPSDLSCTVITVFHTSLLNTIRVLV